MACFLRNTLFLSLVVQWLGRVWLLVAPWTASCQASLSITISQSLPKLMSTESVMPSNHLIFCCPFLLLPSIFPSIRVFPLSQVFASGGKGLELQHRFFQWVFSVDFLLDGLVWSPWSPRDSQESSPTSQFKSVNSSVLSPLYGPSLTSAPYCTPISPLETTSLFSVSLSLHLFLLYSLVYCIFQIPHVSDIIQYLSFSVWLISLSIIPLVAIYIAMNGKMLSF